MPYNKQRWENFPSTSSPLSAQRMNNLETQYDAAYSDLNPKITSTNNQVSNLTGRVQSLESNGVSGQEGVFGSYIKHVEQPGFDYEVIRVPRGLHSIKKLQPKAMTGATIQNVQKLTPLEMRNESGFQSLVNADAAVIVSGATQRVNGIHIIDGRALQNFGVVSGGLRGSDEEALLLMRDGKFKPARKSENKTAQQYVDEGAYSSFGYGPIVVENGQRIQWWTDPRFSGFVGEKSSRIILGQDREGNFIIILVDGVSGSYGIQGSEITDLAIKEGCHIAVNLDGGGSTQGVWQGRTFHPSTDAAGPRRLMSYIGIARPPENVYSSGRVTIPNVTGVTAADNTRPAVYLTQTGSDVRLNCNVSAPLTEANWTQISQSALHPRYRAASGTLMRGQLSANTNRQAVASFTSDTYLLNMRSAVGSGSPNTSVGSFTWELGYE